MNISAEILKEKILFFLKVESANSIHAKSFSLTFLYVGLHDVCYKNINAQFDCYKFGLSQEGFS